MINEPFKLQAWLEFAMQRYAFYVGVGVDPLDAMRLVCEEAKEIQDVLGISIK